MPGRAQAGLLALCLGFTSDGVPGLSGMSRSNPVGCVLFSLSDYAERHFCVFTCFLLYLHLRRSRIQEVR